MIELMRFVLPDDGNHLIAALTVLQSYRNKRQTNDDWRGIWHVWTRDDGVHELLANKRLGVVIRDKDEAATQVDDVEMDFDFALEAERAYRMSVPTKRHLVDIYGLLLGTRPTTVRLEIPQGTNLHSHRCLVASNEAGLAATVTGLLPKKWTVEWTNLMPVSPIPDLRRGLDSMSMVIGFPSIVTYLGASMGLHVVELYPEYQYHRGWLHKHNGDGRYHMVTVDEGGLNDYTLLNAALKRVTDLEEKGNVSGAVG
jgi:hypothetical protein